MFINDLFENDDFAPSKRVAQQIEQDRHPLHEYLNYDDYEALILEFSDATHHTQTEEEANEYLGSLAAYRRNNFPFDPIFYDIVEDWVLDRYESKAPGANEGLLEDLNLAFRRTWGITKPRVTVYNLTRAMQKACVDAIRTEREDELDEADDEEPELTADEREANLQKFLSTSHPDAQKRLYRGQRRAPKPDRFITTKGRETPSFTDDPEVANVYSRHLDGNVVHGPGSTSVPVYLQMQRPLDIRGLGEYFSLLDFLNVLPNVDLTLETVPNGIGYYDLYLMLSDLDELIYRVSAKSEIDASGSDSIYRIRNFEELADEVLTSGEEGDVNQIEYMLSESYLDSFVIADSPDIVQKLTAMGYDGVILTDIFTGGAPYYQGDKEKLKPGTWDDEDKTVTAYRPFDQGKIKSAIGNRGTYNTSNPDITRESDDMFAAPRSVGGKYWDSQPEEFTQLWNALVPDSGQAETLEGELLRAANRLYYQYFNNGFMNNTSGAENFIRQFGAGSSRLRHALDTIHPYTRCGNLDNLENNRPEENKVEIALDVIMDNILHQIISAQGNYHPNPGDMFEYSEEDDPIDDDDEDDEYWYDNQEDDEDENQ